MAMLRYNAGKPPITLVPTIFIKTIGFGRTRLVEDVARVLDFGQKKYSANNWRKGGSWNTVMDCAFRHMNKIARGETHDDESGLHHYAHVGCNIAFQMEFFEQASGIDDRYVLPKMWDMDENRPGNPFDDIYDHLLRWKDGDGFSLNEATDLLAQHYEELNPGIVPGSSPNAHIQLPLIATFVSDLGPHMEEALRATMPPLETLRNTTL
ncbi:DUF5664 domain-containing protein [Mesorhizobium sp. M0016]|uniref:dATP/dGTP diphosphohydrolase domain-containing protein n=1 Tax=Mesorhizobium sp. M0016 TaxID=2956843 RepID=UPI00333B00D8